MRALISVLGRLAPRLVLPTSLDAEGLSRDPEVVAAYVADPLVDKRYTARLVSQLMRAITAIEAGAGAVEVPLLVVHGEADPLCPAEGSRRFVERVPSAGSEFRVYAGLRHEVLNEPEREQVMDDIATWLDKHAAQA
jgi:alpha-beta hydrolase superfamily lysophospholipase